MDLFLSVFLYLGVFLVALCVTILLVPPVIKLAQKVGALDAPEKRKVHLEPIPRLGGVSIFAGFSGAIFLALIMGFFLNRGLNPVTLLGALFGGALMVGIGIWDDIRGLSAGKKLVLQIGAALIAIASGIQIDFVTNPFGTLIPLGLLAIPITLFWLVGITNAINLIDGLDGLAAGITAISSTTLFVVAIRTHQIDAAVLMIALAGVSLGFLRYNFYPASIFLGDSGSYLLGFILAVSSVVGVLKSTIVIALIIPVIILGIPIYDTASVILRRVRGGVPVLKADRRHIHHQLLAAGFTQREAVLSIYLACMLLSTGALVMTIANAAWSVVVLFVIFVAAIISIDRIKAQLRKAIDQNLSKGETGVTG